MNPNPLFCRTKNAHRSAAVLLVLAVFLAQGVGRSAAQIVELENPRPEDGAEFGSTVARIPDVTGDGVEDFVIGARTQDSDSGLQGAGRAYLYSGATLTFLREFTSSWAQAYSVYASSVIHVPDQNGDGVADVAMGGFNHDVLNLRDAGEVLFLSGTDASFIGLAHSPNAQWYGTFGVSMCVIPDTDGDATEDYAIGAEEDVGDVDTAGRVYVYSGADRSLLYSLTAPVPGFDGFGASLDGVPDVDGDGRGDIVVGAYIGDEAHVFSGATGEYLYTLESPYPTFEGRFGLDVLGLEDLTGDGRGEILVGAYGEEMWVSPGVTYQGLAHLYSGADGQLLKTFTLPGPNTSGFFGYRVARISDMNYDGLDEFVIGAPAFRSVYVYSGATFDLLATLSVPVLDDSWVCSSTFSEFDGMELGGMDDLDGDGAGDIVIGMPCAVMSDGDRPGQAFVFLSDCNRNGVSDFVDVPFGAGSDPPAEECEVFGRCNTTGSVDLSDAKAVSDCLTGPGTAIPAYDPCHCHDADANGQLDLIDAASLMNRYGSPRG